MPPRRPFTGIHEIPRTWGGNVPREGGGLYKPYGEDLFQRIVDVNWSGFGAVFVVGDFCCFNFYVKVDKDGNITTKDLGTLSLGGSGTTTSSSYGHVGGRTPTFLIGGHTGGFSNGIIMASNDGLSWKRSLFMQAGVVGADVDVLVWDGERFFCNAYEGSFSFPTCMSSRDGYVWTLFGSGTAQEHSPVGLPDGQWGYNPATDLFLTSSEVINEGEWAGGANAGALTFAGGIWAAGFFNRVFLSADDTETWIDVGINAPYNITTVAGAPLSHFK